MGSLGNAHYQPKLSATSLCPTQMQHVVYQKKSSPKLLDLLKNQKKNQTWTERCFTGNAAKHMNPADPGYMNGLTSVTKIQLGKLCLETNVTNHCYTWSHEGKKFVGWKLNDLRTDPAPAATTCGVQLQPNSWIAFEPNQNGTCNHIGPFDYKNPEQFTLWGEIPRA